MRHEVDPESLVEGAAVEPPPTLETKVHADLVAELVIPAARTGAAGPSMHDALRILGQTVRADDAGLKGKGVCDRRRFADEGELKITPAGVGAIAWIRVAGADVSGRVDVLAEGEADIFLIVAAVYEGQRLDESFPPAGLPPVDKIGGEPGKFQAVGVMLVGVGERVVFEIHREHRG